MYQRPSAPPMTAMERLHEFIEWAREPGPFSALLEVLRWNYVQLPPRKQRRIRLAMWGITACLGLGILWTYRKFED